MIQRYTYICLIQPQNRPSTNPHTACQHLSHTLQYHALELRPLPSLSLHASLLFLWIQVLSRFLCLRHSPPTLSHNPTLPLLSPMPSPSPTTHTAPPAPRPCTSSPCSHSPLWYLDPPHPPPSRSVAILNFHGTKNECLLNTFEYLYNYISFYFILFYRFIGTYHDDHLFI